MPPRWPKPSEALRLRRGRSPGPTLTTPTCAARSAISPSRPRTLTSPSCCSAGHGMEVDGTNDRLPAVDAVLERDLDVEDEAISLDRLVKVMEPVKRLRLVILDACRDNPFKKTHEAHDRFALDRPRPRQGRGAVFEHADRFRGQGRSRPPQTATARTARSPRRCSTTSPCRVLIFASPSGACATRCCAAPQSQEPFVYGSLGGDTVALVPQAAVPADPDATARQDYEFAAQIGTKQAWDFFLAVHAAGFYADLARAQNGQAASRRAGQRQADEARRRAEEQATRKPRTSASSSRSRAPADRGGQEAADRSGQARARRGAAQGGRELPARGR